MHHILSFNCLHHFQPNIGLGPSGWHDIAIIVFFSNFSGLMALKISLATSLYILMTQPILKRASYFVVDSLFIIHTWHLGESVTVNRDEGCPRSSGQVALADGAFLFHHRWIPKTNELPTMSKNDCVGATPFDGSNVRPWVLAITF